MSHRETRCTSECRRSGCPIETILVEVTQEHINRGVAGNCKRCPVGIALADAGLELPEVTLDPVRKFPKWQKAWASFWVNAKLRMTVALPLEVARWIADFDKGKPVEPFRFVLNLEFAL